MEVMLPELSEAAWIIEGRRSPTTKKQRELPPPSTTTSWSYVAAVAPTVVLQRSI